MWRDFAAWDRHRLTEIDLEIQGDSYTTDDADWNLRIAMETARWKDPDVMRGFADVVSPLATPEDALVKSGLMEEVTTLGAGTSRYPDPGPTRRELLATLAND